MAHSGLRDLESISRAFSLPYSTYLPTLVLIISMAARARAYRRTTPVIYRSYAGTDKSRHACQSMNEI